MKRFNEMDYTEKKETAALFAAWLKPYTKKVIVAVLEKREEIMNNDFVMGLLKELKARQDMESEDFAHSIHNLLDDFEVFEQYDPHNHPLTHSGAYRDILYDMYIKDI